MNRRRVLELARIHYDDDIGPILRDLVRMVDAINKPIGNLADESAMRTANAWDMDMERSDRIEGEVIPTVEWVRRIQRDAFDAGATAMRDRIAKGLKAWWTAARATAGRHWPGHPHAVVCKVEQIDVTTTEGRP